MKKKSKNTKLEIGDVVFIDGRAKWNLIGKMIRFVENGGKHPTTKFMPNHIGTVIESYNDIKECKIIESSLVGVRIMPIKHWSNNSKTNIIIKRCNKLKSEKYKKVLKKWLLKQVGKKYDYPALVGILLRFILLRIVKNKFFKFFIRRMKNPLANKIKFTCSELVARGFKEAIRIYIFKHVDPANITPYDIFRSKKLKTIAKIINFEYE